jgi:hypothetical protein
MEEQNVHLAQQWRVLGLAYYNNFKIVRIKPMKQGHKSITGKKPRETRRGTLWCILCSMGGRVIVQFLTVVVFYEQN